MDRTKLNRLRDELEKARKKRDDWDAKTKDLERRYREAENTCIHDMVHAANLTPEQLAELIRQTAAFLPRTVETEEEETEAETDVSEEAEPEAVEPETASTQGWTVYTSPVPGKEDE